jgi:hypothetical protein
MKKKNSINFKELTQKLEVAWAKDQGESEQIIALSKAVMGDEKRPLEKRAVANVMLILQNEMVLRKKMGLIIFQIIADMEERLNKLEVDSEGREQLQKDFKRILSIIKEQKKARREQEKARQEARQYLEKGAEMYG